MIPVQTAYPKFEANQVLTNEHLNTLFAYLDEQGRLTRTNLIGIGIVCGLEPTVAADGSQMVISKGCGVTSEGYLVVWDNPQPLEFVKPYTVPDDIAYAVFNNNSGGAPTQYPLWELTADRNNDPTALPLTQNFLRGTAQPAGSEDEKVLLLFLECKTESNKNCSPNSCDDKGAMVTATVRPLLIRKRDMDAIQASVRALGGGAAEYLDLSASTSLRFNLPEVQLRRYNVESSRLATTDDVFNAYQTVLNQPFLNNVADAFSAAYTAFRPLLVRDFPADPFANLKAEWAYLHNGGIVSLNRYLWYQYYYDHLDTVLQAYNEFREVSTRVMGLCCPDSRVFPRHLMLANVGVTPPEMSVYRHHFVPSPLYSKAQTALSDVVILFKRLVELLRQLDLPPLSDAGGNNQNPIKITPSKLGAFPLSDKAIPYHYRPNPLVQYWDYRKTRYNKARFNLGYRSPDWNISDDAVLAPLRYDLEPNNFLRVEGHIGKNYREVLYQLLTMKQDFRLPIEIVALKTGSDSSDIPLPIDVEDCHCGDLERLRDTFLLQNYTDKHPGIQHKAGVPLGGTFIIVYEESSSTTPVRGPFKVSGRISNPPRSGVRITVKNTKTTVNVNIDGNFTIDINDDEAAVLIFDANGFNMIELTLLEKTANLGNVFLTRGILNIFTEQRFFPEKPTSPLANLVIADFYLPYLVASNCPPVQFILPDSDAKTVICDYRWVSKKTHLEKSDRNYRLNILSYTINNQAVGISEDQKINIPQAEINENPMLAIATALNNLGGNGIRFGVTDDGFKLTISRAENTTFLIEFQERNDPNYPVIYQLTQDGIRVNPDSIKQGFELPTGEGYYGKENCR